MHIRFISKIFFVSFILMTALYLILYFSFDISISEFALNKLRLNNSSVIKSFNALCGHLVFRVLALSLLLVYLFFNKKLFANKALFIAITLIVAMLFDDVLKYFFGRARPIEFFKNQVYGMQWFQSADIFNSTPSGHSTRAMALCMSLVLLCKKRFVQIILVTFAVLQALCRVVLLRHYLSDVIFGMWLGFFVAVYLYTVMLEKNNYCNVS